MILARLHDERGDSAIELTLVLPALMAVIAMCIIAGRYGLTSQAVETAAAQAARTATLERTATAAQVTAATSATTMLQAQNLHCTSLDTTVDTSGFTIPVGTRAELRVTITCQLALADITAPGLPGTVTITRTATSPLDTYRGRS